LDLLPKTDRDTSGLVERLTGVTSDGPLERDTTMSTGPTLEVPNLLVLSLTTERVMKFAWQFSTIFTMMELGFMMCPVIIANQSFAKNETKL